MRGGRDPPQGDAEAASVASCVGRPRELVLADIAQQCASHNGTACGHKKNDESIKVFVI